MSSTLDDLISTFEEFLQSNVIDDDQTDMKTLDALENLFIYSKSHHLKWTEMNQKYLIGTIFGAQSLETKDARKMLFKKVVKHLSPSHETIVYALEYMKPNLQNISILVDHGIRSHHADSVYESFNNDSFFGQALSRCFTEAMMKKLSVYSIDLITKNGGFALDALFTAWLKEDIDLAKEIPQRLQSLEEYFHFSSKNSKEIGYNLLASFRRLYYTQEKINPNVPLLIEKLGDLGYLNVNNFLMNLSKEPALEMCYQHLVADLERNSLQHQTPAISRPRNISRL